MCGPHLIKLAPLKHGDPGTLTDREKGHLGTMREFSLLPAKERAFRGNQPCQHLDLGLLASKAVGT